MKTKKTFTELPNSVISKIEELNLTDEQKYQSKKLLAVIKYNCKSNGGDLTSFVPLPKDYLTNLFTDKYSSFINILLQNDIILKENYNVELGICNHFAFNPYYLKYNEGWSRFEYTLGTTNFYSKGTFKTKTQEANKFKEDLMISNWVENDLKKLNINYSELRRLVDVKVNSIKIEDFYTNESVKHNFFKRIFLYDTFVKNVSKAYVLKVIETSGGTLYQNGDNYYVYQDANDFLQFVKTNIHQSYNDMINYLESGYYWSRRNITNNRLDTNLTSLCHLLFDQICVDNNLKQIDLSNSQYTILSHILSKDENINNKVDFLLFKRLCVEGGLYEHIQSEVGFKSRKEAKNAMMLLMFSKHTYTSDDKDKLKALFPSVVEWCDNYKKNKGDNQLAIMLQKEESKIFIDGIYYPLKRKGLFLFSKHDSIICSESDYETVNNFIVNKFESMNFIANFKN